MTMMEMAYDKTWLILAVIAVAAAFKIISQMYRERTTRRRPRYSGSPLQWRNRRQERRERAASAESTRLYAEDPVTPTDLVRRLIAEPNEFGPVNYYANARHGQEDRWFQFLYRKVNGEWLTYIQRMPSLNGRSGNLHLTHRYNSGNTYWICYDPQPRTLKDAQNISRAWGDRELEYITTGTPFEDQRW